MSVSEGELKKRLAKAVIESIMMGKTVSGLDGILDEAKKEFPLLLSKLKQYSGGCYPSINELHEDACNYLLETRKWFKKYFGDLEKTT
jgi:hypothetical protein